MILKKSISQLSSRRLKKKKKTPTRKTRAKMVIISCSFYSSLNAISLQEELFQMQIGTMLTQIYRLVPTERLILTSIKKVYRSSGH